MVLQTSSANDGISDRSRSHALPSQGQQAAVRACRPRPSTINSASAAAAIPKTAHCRALRRDCNENPAGRALSILAIGSASWGLVCKLR